MSATLPTEYIDTHVASAKEYVCDILKRLSFQQRLWRVASYSLMGLTSIVLMLFVLGVLDFVWHFGRALRFMIVLPLVLFTLALFVYAVSSLSKRISYREMARDVERAARQKENALVTFAQSLDRTFNGEVQPYMLSRLGLQARKNLESVDVKVVAPRRGAAQSLSLFLLVLFLILVVGVSAPKTFALELRRIVRLERDETSSRNVNHAIGTNPTSNVIAIENIHVRVIPPVYTGLGAEDAPGDAPVRALAGSQIEVELAISGNFKNATLGYADGLTQMRLLGEGNYRGSFVAHVSGVFEARVVADLESTPQPIVRAVEVYEDVPPEVHVTEPASDQLLRGVPIAPITVHWNARDDLGLSAVVLKYIRSRGEGDAAQFVNGSVPLAGIERDSAREWRGGAMLDLARLGLQAGDTLVFWVEAQDRNPSVNNTGRSSSLAIAIMAPEPVKLELGDLRPNEIGRFLLSERMIIIHTEKLHADRKRIPRNELLSQAQEIAAEQRDFKNSFNEYVRLEGVGEEPHDPNSIPSGNIEDQVQEAEQERTGVHMHGIPDPPSGSPSNVRDMVYAIRAMWDAEDALSLGDTAKALVDEREALTRLKRAQLAVRYVPPVLASSKPIDLKRRYAGELNEIKTRLEKLSRPAESKEKVSLRAALGETYAALAELHSTLDTPVTARGGAVARALERTRKSANDLAGVGGDHATTIAEALGQLRIVEAELSRLDVSGGVDSYASRVNRPMALLAQAAANLFAIAEARTRASGGEASTVLPTDNRRTSDYFRRLNK